MSDGPTVVMHLPSEVKEAPVAAPAGPTQATVDAAAQKIRDLKQANAPQIQVRAAVEAHALEYANFLKATNAPAAEVKAAVINYTLLIEDPLVLTAADVAAKKVRQLKLNDAPVAEVKAAVEAYNALVQPKAETKETKEAEVKKADAPAPAVSSPSALEQAADKVRSLKAAKAPQAEVKAAVEAYVALQSASQGGENKPTVANVAVPKSTVEEAADRVRALKAAKAPQAEVKAAVEAYVALTGGQSAPAQGETKHASKSAVDEAADRVRSLKAAKAPQAEVKAAVEAYIALTGGQAASAPQAQGGKSAVEEAADKVRALKAAKAPQAEVKAAVEAYVALTGGAQGERKN